MGMWLLLLFLIRHHLWECTGKAVVTFLFPASQPLPSKAKGTSSAQLLYQQVKGFCGGSFTVIQKWVQRTLWTESNMQPVLVARNMQSCSSFQLSVLLFWLREFHWVKKPTLELSSLKRKLTGLIVRARGDWWDHPSLKGWQSLSLSGSGKLFHLPKFRSSSPSSYPAPKEKGALRLLEIEVSCDLSDLKFIDFADPRTLAH